MHPVDDMKGRVSELAELMDEFRLNQAELSGEGWRIALRKRAAVQLTQAVTTEAVSPEAEVEEAPTPVAAPAAPQGMPVSSPMTGIYYASPSPSAPPFVKEGDSVTSGQVVGLIEAMKVFNEIVAPMNGIVSKVAATSGQLVNPGDPLLYIS